MKATPGALSQASSGGEGESSKAVSFGDIKKQITSIRTSVNRLIMAYSFAAKVNGADFAEDYAARSMGTMEDVLGTPDLDFAEDTKQVATWKKVKVKDRVGALTQGMELEPRTIYPTNIEGSYTAKSYSSGVSGYVQRAYDAVKNSLVSGSAKIPSTYGKYLVKKVKVYTTLQFWKTNAGKEGFHSRAVAPVDDISVLVEPKVRTILGLRIDSKVLEKIDTRKEKRQAVIEYMDQINRLMTTGEK